MTSTPLTTTGTTARLLVNLTALTANYHILRRAAAPAVCAAVVKADAYGLGVGPVACALWAAGCRVFYVALLSEAEVLRNHVRDAEIYVLSGLLPGAAADFHHLGVHPVLASRQEADEWSHYCQIKNIRLPAVIHVDTGINRIGMEYREAEQFFQNDRNFQDFDLCMVMSHLACGDEPDHGLNDEQVNLFAALRQYVPGVAFSLANSAGILSAPDTHFDMVRPGIALYGSNPVADSDTTLERVVTLEAAVLQVRNVAAGQSVGYGATFVARRASKIAILGLGYADGYFRNLSAANRHTKAHVTFSGQRAPVIGRVSMDMIGVDVTDLPAAAVKRGMMAEVIGENISLDGVAHASETISYELLTRLGNRFDRVYINHEATTQGSAV